ncbi:MAG TPA: tryptophan synthase subunit beta [bacterium]|nr:tryptophan synthase subunit beta [bacterium]
MTAADSTGYFGPYGGQFAPEILMGALAELRAAYDEFKHDPSAQEELDEYLRQYAGRPTPLYHAAQLSRELGADIYLKREDLTHTGAHKINNTLGQALLAVRMGKRRLIAETGAGQHGVATATVAALFKRQCTVYMGREDTERQALNVVRMKLLGAEVRPVDSGSKTLKDATTEAIRDWVTNVADSYYMIGSVIGPAPYPAMVRDFQRVIGLETRAQFARQYGGMPDCLVACVGAGSNSLGLFHPFFDVAGTVKMVGVEAGGLGLASGKHGASLTAGRPGVLHGALSYLLMDGDGQVRTAHSISAGLDYPGVGPEHAYCKDQGLVRYVSATDDEAQAAFQQLTRIEGIIPALESSHALAYLPTLVAEGARGKRIVVCLSGRGDKDVESVARRLGLL